ncbi:regucalcin-like [Diabrotica virgifera virgifera]|uniref:Regucalcin n=1 Tax=Diabrotica virgifera virgifera TaxID=50390 RepID=A0A6P7FHU4_DIAVI|nr:regucalcin-like [Diabrotica virgifera virgifera]
MAPVIEKLLNGLKIGEGPHWDVQKQCLYFVDIPNSTIHKYVPSTKKHTKAKIGNHNVSIIIPVRGKSDEFVVTVDNTVSLIKWDGESSEVGQPKVLYEVEKGTTHVFNDGKCDKTGRLWSGTLGLRIKSLEDVVMKKGALYSFYKNKLECHRNELSVANGIAFDHKLKKMYYIDSLCYGVDQYDIDLDQGTLSNMKTVFSTKHHGLNDHALCDGMTIDTNGNLWVAIFGSSSVYNIDPRTGSVLQVIKFPAVQITSVAFGGQNFDELYVTSATLDGEEKGECPGTLFRVTGLSARGLPADEFVV